MNAKLRVIISGTMLCALFVVGCRNTSTPRVDQNVRAATDIHKAELLKELNKKWENPPVHFELGRLYHTDGDYSKAEYYYNQALNFNPAYREVQAAMVKLQLDKGNKTRADWVANGYMVQLASMPEQMLSLGAAFEKQGLDDYALKCYQEALKTTPDSSTVNRQLGYYYLTRNKKDLAKEYFIRSFQLNPDQADVAGELGRLGVAVRIPQSPAPAPPPASDVKQTAKPASQPNQ
jgi:tetratricopeptide (TPR) repeat protein